MRLKLWLNME